MKPVILPGYCSVFRENQFQTFCGSIKNITWQFTILYIFIILLSVTHIINSYVRIYIFVMKFYHGKYGPHMLWTDH